MNKIVVFQKPNFQGLNKEFTFTQKDLKQWNFNMCIASITVTGQPWMLYEDTNCVGRSFVYEEGEYANILSAMYIQSIELVTEELSNPKLTLYYNNMGQDFVRETNLVYGSLNDKSDSCLAHQGVWILYENGPDPSKSKYMVIRPAQKKVNLVAYFFNNIVSYVKPLKGGKSKVTTNVLWDQLTKGDEVVESVTSMTGENFSSESTEFTLTSSKTVEATMTYSFNFSNSTTVEVGLSASIELIGEFSTSVSNTFTFSSGRTESSTVTTEVEIEVPATIPPKSRLNVHVMRKRYTARVPVEVIIERNNSKSMTMGELVCDSGRTIFAEYDTEDL
ncbi:epidermal differentiation-specific protein-like [Discoglossus pictus]